MSESTTVTRTVIEMYAPALLDVPMRMYPNHCTQWAMQARIQLVKAQEEGTISKDEELAARKRIEDWLQRSTPLPM